MVHLSPWKAELSPGGPLWSRLCLWPSGRMPLGGMDRKWGAWKAAPWTPEPGVDTLHEPASSQGPPPSPTPCCSPPPSLLGGTGQWDACQEVPNLVQMVGDHSGTEERLRWTGHGLAHDLMAWWASLVGEWQLGCDLKLSYLLFPHLLHPDWTGFFLWKGQHSRAQGSKSLFLIFWV